MSSTSSLHLSCSKQVTRAEADDGQTHFIPQNLASARLGSENGFRHVTEDSVLAKPCQPCVTFSVCPKSVSMNLFMVALAPHLIIPPSNTGLYQTLSSQIFFSLQRPPEPCPELVHKTSMQKMTNKSRVKQPRKAEQRLCLLLQRFPASRKGDLKHLSRHYWGWHASRPLTPTSPYQRSSLFLCTSIFEHILQIEGEEGGWTKLYDNAFQEQMLCSLFCQ